MACRAAFAVAVLALAIPFTFAGDQDNAAVSVKEEPPSEIRARRERQRAHDEHRKRTLTLPNPRDIGTHECIAALTCSHSSLTPAAALGLLTSVEKLETFSEGTTGIVMQGSGSGPFNIVVKPRLGGSQVVAAAQMAHVLGISTPRVTLVHIPEDANGRELCKMLHGISRDKHEKLIKYGSMWCKPGSSIGVLEMAGGEPNYQIPSVTANQDVDFWKQLGWILAFDALTGRKDLLAEVHGNYLEYNRGNAIVRRVPKTEVIEIDLGIHSDSTMSISFGTTVVLLNFSHDPRGKDYRRRMHIARFPEWLASLSENTHARVPWFINGNVWLMFKNHCQLQGAAGFEPEDNDGFLSNAPTDTYQLTTLMEGLTALLGVYEMLDTIHKHASPLLEIAARVEIYERPTAGEHKSVYGRLQLIQEEEGREQRAKIRRAISRRLHSVKAALQAQLGEATESEAIM